MTAAQHWGFPLTNQRLSQEKIISLFAVVEACINYEHDTQ